MHLQRRIFKDWKTVISEVTVCATNTPEVPEALCDWLEHSGNLVQQSITFTSLDSRLDDLTAAEFDRKYFPLIYGAQGFFFTYTLP